MSKSKKEMVYDEQIAPLMGKIIEICKASDLGISALFELSDNFTVQSHVERKNSTARMRMEYYLMRADGNLDLFILHCRRDAEKHGHSSAILKMLGTVPAPPAATEQKEAGE